MKTLTPLFIFLFFCLPLNAEVYSYRDANGNTIYTDNPPKGQQTRLIDIETRPSSTKTNENVIKEETTSNSSSEQSANSDEIKTIKLSPPGSTPAIEDGANSNAPNADSSLSSSHQNSSVNYLNLQIITPKPNTVVTNSGGQMMIEVKSDPLLVMGHKYRFLIDNKLMGELTSPVLSVNNLERGEHKLKVIIVDAQGKKMNESTEIVFFVRQTTLADKRRIRPCELADYGIRPECPLKDRPAPESLLRKTANAVKSIINSAVNTAAEGAVNSAIP